MDSVCDTRHTLVPQMPDVWLNESGLPVSFNNQRNPAGKEKIKGSAEARAIKYSTSIAGYDSPALLI